MKEKKAKWIAILLVAVLVAVVADITVRLSTPDKSKQPSKCLTIPVKYAMEYPNCTNNLLKAANLTNVHIVPPGTLEARRLRQSELYNSNFSGK